MARSAHAGFNPSQLVRCLADLDIPEAADSKQTVAERLSPWLGWADAISLAGLLNGGPPKAAAAALTTPAAPAAALSASLDFNRVRTDLALSITQPAWRNADSAGATLPAQSAAASDAVDLSTWRSHYLAQQQAMEARITPLRARLRAALTAASPALSRLAALDAVLESALAVRERQLLGSVPGLLDKHLQAQQGAALSGGSAPAFGATVQAVLLAELTLRLQPVEGLLAALGAHIAEPT